MRVIDINYKTDVLFNYHTGEPLICPVMSTDNNTVHCHPSCAWLNFEMKPNEKKDDEDELVFCKQDQIGIAVD